MKVQNAIAKLSHILPLKARLDDLDQDRARIYFSILHGFYQLGRAPLLSELREEHINAQQRLSDLGGLDMLTLDDSGEIRGCYPFSMENRGHTMQLNGFKMHAMCALDALAPSAMFACSSTIESECAVSGEPVHIELNEQTVTNPDQAADIHVGINWMAADSCCSCSDSLCTEMLFLKDSETAQQWANQDSENREIYDLPQAIAFSAGFFVPQLKQG